MVVAVEAGDQVAARPACARDQRKHLHPGEGQRDLWRNRPAERHHDVALADAFGRLPAKHPVTDDAAGSPLPLDRPHRLP
ncbi:hypothetical protein DY245_12750 [Streptomyces inhibens]|uniref:Uncharacterized protein n=1 Tax=Streptomyces inhibens TaxID=2293571 RepID=A0A371Q5G0_STRIH|nr:hypothetical protein DY245_12750 [Streptomyces inhibens]